MEADGLKSPLATKSSLFAISKSILAKFNLGFIWSEITEAVLKLVGVLKLGINDRLISSGDLEPMIFWKFFLPDISSFRAVINFACAPARDDSDWAKSVRLISPLSNRDLSLSTCLSKRSTFNWLNSRFLKLYPKL